MLSEDFRLASIVSFQAPPGVSPFAPRHSFSREPCGLLFRILITVEGSFCFMFANPTRLGLQDISRCGRNRTGKRLHCREAVIRGVDHRHI
eukprot:jgi/Botrbrau1/18541/Bobra.0598s0005.1